LASWCQPGASVKPEPRVPARPPAVAAPSAQTTAAPDDHDDDTDPQSAVSL